MTRPAISRLGLLRVALAALSCFAIGQISGVARAADVAPRATDPDVTVTANAVAASATDESKQRTDRLTWGTSYGAGLKAAEAAGKLLVLQFTDDRTPANAVQFERDVLAAGAVGDVLEHCVLVRLSQDAKIRVGGQDVVLLNHPSFADLGGQPGMAVIDTVHKASPKFRQVVSTLATSNRAATQEALLAIIEPHLPEEALGKLVELRWSDDYGKALSQAEKEKRMLVVYFTPPQATDSQQVFEREALTNLQVRRRLRRFVLAKLPTKAEVKVENQPVQLLKHPAFDAMYGREGLAIIDATDKDSRLYHQVVSAFPFSSNRRFDAQRTSVVLDLPKGTLTQRTLIYAVRMHGEHPASTDGAISPLLESEAESHSQYQADIDNQGHHNWDSRFQRISAQLPDGMAAQEVCAESWPGQELVDAAEECVSSWRQSSGHWSAVSARQPLFGYDMKLGHRMVWYATGIFGRH